MIHVKLAEELAGMGEEPAITARISLERLFAQLPDAHVKAI